MWASVGFAVLSTVWGVLTGSTMIVFDGVYSFVSIGLSVLAVLAIRFAGRGADERFPWGREAAEPVVVVKAALLAALCTYAAVDGVLDLLAGGRSVDSGWALAYAVVATAGGLAVGLVLQRAARAPRPERPGGAASDLVRAEAAEWIGDTLLSAGVLAGFLVHFWLVSRGRTDLAAYVDPGMVVLTSLGFLVVPARLIARGMREVLAMSPPDPVLDQLRSALTDVETRFGLQSGVLRASKVGSRMDIEITFVVGNDSPVRTVLDCDAVRTDLHERLTALGYERSVIVAFTTDARWAQ